VKPDWIEGTILKKNLADVLGYLHELLGDFQELPRGMMGYNHAAIVAGSGRVCWDDKRDDMGIHVSLPATAITNLGYNPVSLLIDLCENLGMRLSRLDLAADDLKGTLNFDAIENSVRCVHFVSRWTKVRRFEEIENGQSLGRTYYFGSPSSDTQIRIYDKAAERRAAGENFVGHWIRVEMQLRDERAHKAAEHIVKHPDTWQVWAAGLIKGYLDFKTVSSDSNKSRWLTATWWDDFLGRVSKERITFSRDIPTIERVQEWFDRQLAPSLCAMQTVLGADTVSKMIASNSSRMKAKHRAMIDLARKYPSRGLMRETIASD
jgi:phage replication initiation protein